MLVTRRMFNHTAMYRAITYTCGDVLYMQDISNDARPSIWEFNLTSGELQKLVEGVRFLQPKLNINTLPCDGRYLPVLKGTKLCVLDLDTKELIKVKNKGQWIDRPVDAVVSNGQVIVMLRSDQLGGDSDSECIFCSFQLEDSQFRKLRLPKNRKYITYYYDNISGLLYTETGAIEIGVGDDIISYIDATSYPPKITAIEVNDLKDSSVRLWKNKLFWMVSDSDLPVYMMDLETGKQEKIAEDIGSSKYYSGGLFSKGHTSYTADYEVFACIGQNVYLRKECSWRFEEDGYRISLQEPFEKFPLRLNPLARGTEDRYSWREDDDED